MHIHTHKHTCVHTRARSQSPTASLACFVCVCVSVCAEQHCWLEQADRHILLPWLRRGALLTSRCGQHQRISVYTQRGQLRKDLVQHCISHQSSAPSVKSSMQHCAFVSNSLATLKAVRACAVRATNAKAVRDVHAIE